MVALSRCLGSAAFLIACADGARVARQKVAGTKFIAGVPVLNYDAAYGGAGVLGELETAKEEEWVLMLEPRTSTNDLKSMCQKAANGCNFVGNPSDGGVPFVEIRGTEGDLEAMIRSSSGAVRYIEPDMTVNMIPEIEEAPSTRSTETWGLRKIGQDDAPGRGEGTTVFVLDTGIRVSHQEFENRGVTHWDATQGWFGKDCDGDTNCAVDRQGHGTHCAGTATGKTFGVASKATVGAIKVLGDDGSGKMSWSQKGLDYIASSSIRPAVASMSLGGAGTSNGDKDAVNAAVAAGVVVVVAAGNENADACGFSPAFVPAAITVGSTDAYDRRSYFSCYGSCVDIWAPGSGIKSARHDSDTGNTQMSGTSMACPHVAGSAALVLEAFPGTHASSVTSTLLTMAKSGQVTDLTSADTNKLLFVGEPVPVPPPSPPASCGGWGRRRRGC